MVSAVALAFFVRNAGKDRILPSLQEVAVIDLHLLPLVTIRKLNLGNLLHLTTSRHFTYH